MRSETRAARRLTIGGMIEAGTRQLASAGVASPRRDAERITADLLDISPGKLVLERDLVLDPDRRFWLMAAFSRRARGEPVPYVTGVAGFRRLAVRTGPGALIPRPETEGLVERALMLCSTGVAVDVGTGTGCIALSLRDEGRYRLVLGIDRSADALRIAEGNRHRLVLAIELLRGDLLGPLASGSVDVLVSNPPYVSAAEYAALDPSVRDYEPREALESGSDGLDATRRLVVDGMRVVRPGGIMAVELAADRAAACAGLATEAGWGSVRVEEDLFGRPRYLVARREG